MQYNHENLQTEGPCIELNQMSILLIECIMYKLCIIISILLHCSSEIFM